MAARRHGAGKTLAGHGRRTKAYASLMYRRAQGALRRGVGRVPMPNAASIGDVNLRNIVGNLYHGAQRAARTGGPLFGHGGTADAARIERAIGIRIFGRDHVGAARQYVRALERWEARHSANASPADRQLATDLWYDLSNALGGR